LEEDGEGYVLKNKVKNLFPMIYRPELDVSDELGSELSSRYLQLIGIVHWAIELGCIDIFHKVSLLSQYQVSPRVGHLEVMYHVFAYLRNHLDMGQIAYDSLAPMLNDLTFQGNADWTDFYGDVQEEFPPKMLKLRGNPVTISAFVDANHAGNKVT
jgi:hypothetical protein